MVIESESRVPSSCQSPLVNHHAITSSDLLRGRRVRVADVARVGGSRRQQSLLPIRIRFQTQARSRQPQSQPVGDALRNVFRSSADNLGAISDMAIKDFSPSLALDPRAYSGTDDFPSKLDDGRLVVPADLVSDIQYERVQGADLRAVGACGQRPACGDHRSFEATVNESGGRRE